MSRDVESYFVELFGAILGAIVAGIGAAMAWFNGSKRNIYRRIDGVEEDNNKIRQAKAEADVRMERVQTCQENTALQLTELKAGQERINEKIDGFYRDVMQALTKSS